MQRSLVFLAIFAVLFFGCQVFNQPDSYTPEPAAPVEITPANCEVTIWVEPDNVLYDYGQNTRIRIDGTATAGCTSSAIEVDNIDTNEEYASRTFVRSGSLLLDIDTMGIGMFEICVRGFYDNGAVQDAETQEACRIISIFEYDDAPPPQTTEEADSGIDRDMVDTILQDIVTERTITACADTYQESRLEVGQRVIVSDQTPDPLPLRATSALNGIILDRIPVNTELTLMDGPVCNDGITWWYVSYDGNIGWVGEAGNPGGYNLLPVD